MVTLDVMLAHDKLKIGNFPLKMFFVFGFKKVCSRPLFHYISLFSS